MREQMGQKALEVLGAASGKSTDLSKEKALHDKLIKLCSYDVAAAQNPSAYPDSFSAYGAFVNNKAVCEGYAQAMKLLLSSVGIKSLYITGEADGGSHAWNMVEIGGQWSYLDATFDDPVYTDQNGNYVSYNKVSYTYFNFAGNSDHVPGSFDNSDPFSDSSENYAVMPQVG
jgi:transglutaminase/protease-like cytokinesis protein 3